MNRGLALVALASIVACGCSEGPTAPVSGKVTLDGKPLAGAHITFQPQQSEVSADPGSGSYAVTEADGAYTLKMVIGGQPGAAVGKHRVNIIMRDENPDELDRGDHTPKFKVQLPARYNQQSELTCDVPAGGRNDANFELKSK